MRSGKFIMKQQPATFPGQSLTLLATILDATYPILSKEKE